MKKAMMMKLTPRKGSPGDGERDQYQDIECSNSICQHEAFQQTIQNYFQWKTALDNFAVRRPEDEKSLEYQQLVKAESASYDALVSVIDAYCAYQSTRTFLPNED